MKWSSVFLLGILVAALIICSGCTQSGDNSGTVAPVSPSPSLSTLALTAADAPANFTLVESREKSLSEVGSLAKKLGWESGYIVKFSDHPVNGTEPTGIVENLVTYPATSLPGIMNVAEANERAGTDMVFTTLPSPGLGDSSRAFSGKTSGQIMIRKEGDPAVQEPAGTGAPDVVEIIFSKGSTMVVLKMSGPGADYATLRSLAETTWARLP